MHDITKTRLIGYARVSTNGQELQLQLDARHYLPSELTWYMHTLGMRNTSVFGCTVGDFRKCPPTPDHFELLVLAEKAR